MNQLHHGKPALLRVTRFDAAPRGVLGEQGGPWGDEEGQGEQGGADRGSPCPGAQDHPARDGKGQRGKRKDLDAGAEHHGHGRAPCLGAFECDKSQDDEAGDEGVALGVLHAPQDLEQQEEQRDHPSAAGQRALHRGKQHQRIEGAPEEQCERPGNPGERCEEQRKGGTVLEPVRMLGGILGIQIHALHEMARGRAEDLEVAGRYRGAAYLAHDGRAHVVPERAVDGRIRDKRLAGGIDSRDGEVEAEDEASEAWQGDATQPRTDSVGEHVRLRH